jgi:hypothetical protein
MNSNAKRPTGPSPKRRLNNPTPALTWLRHYDKSWLRGDVVAGITLAAYLLPAGLGDASLAGQPAPALRQFSHRSRRHHIAGADGGPGDLTGSAGKAVYHRPRKRPGRQWRRLARGRHESLWAHSKRPTGRSPGRAEYARRRYYGPGSEGTANSSMDNFGLPAQ